MLGIFSNVMRIATGTNQDVHPDERHRRAAEELRRYDLGFYKRWAETKGRYLR